MSLVSFHKIRDLTVMIQTVIVKSTYVIPPKGAHTSGLETVFCLRRTRNTLVNSHGSDSVVIMLSSRLLIIYLLL